MPVNEKKLLEKILTLEAANSLAAKEINELKKELGYAPKPVSAKKAEQNEWLQREMMKSRRREIKSSERKQLNNHY